MWYTLVKLKEQGTADVENLKRELLMLRTYQSECSNERLSKVTKSSVNRILKNRKMITGGEKR